MISGIQQMTFIDGDVLRGVSGLLEGEERGPYKTYNI